VSGEGIGDEDVVREGLVGEELDDEVVHGEGMVGDGTHFDPASSFRGALKARTRNPDARHRALVWIPGPVLRTVPE
jgi:hypothetical protein